MTLPPCPHLPIAPTAMNAGALSALGADRGETFYLTVLTYGQYLWQRGLAARAILCVDRALGADLPGDATVLRAWPMPYAALAWMLVKVPEGVFLGNPRVHYQHLADRMNEPRREQRCWRAWACWAITRQVRPDYLADPKHAVVEPTEELITDKLLAHGLPGEAGLWHGVLHPEG